MAPSNPTPSAMTFAQLIKQHREKEGWTQMRLQQEIYVATGHLFSQDRISQWENGLSDPIKRNKKIVADFFGFSLDSLS